MSNEKDRRALLHCFLMQYCEAVRETKVSLVARKRACELGCPEGFPLGKRNEAKRCGAPFGEVVEKWDLSHFAISCIV